MPKSSINFKPVKSTSESHNNRVSELDYVRKDRSGENESWALMSIPEKREMILDVYKSFHTRKMQKNAEPVREAVVNIEPHHTIEDLKRLGTKLKEKFDVECFQIHIHKDEGMWVNPDGDKVDSVMINGKPDHSIKPEGAVNWNENYHAHMLFDWQEKRPEIYKTYKKKGEERQELMSGKSKKIINYSHAQDITAETLGMQRGEAKANTNRERLEALEYKRQQEQLHLQRVLQSIDEALKKKEQTIERARRVAEEIESARAECSRLEREIEEAKSRTKRDQFNTSKERIAKLAVKGFEQGEKNYEEGIYLARVAIELQQRVIEEQSAKIRSLNEEHSTALAKELRLSAEARSRNQRIESLRGRIRVIKSKRP